MTACQVKYSLTPNHAQTNLKVKVGLKNLALLPNYFDFIFVHLRQKSTSQARIKPEIFVIFRPERDPKSPARLTTLSYTPRGSPSYFSYTEKFGRHESEIQLTLHSRISAFRIN